MLTIEDAERINLPITTIRQLTLANARLYRSEPRNAQSKNARASQVMHVRQPNKWMASKCRDKAYQNKPCAAVVAILLPPALCANSHL